MSRVAAWLLPADTRRRERWLALAFLVLCAVLVARAAHKDEGAIVRVRAFGERFLARTDPYVDAQGQRLLGPYPPTLVWVAAPLALLPLLAARIVWALLQCAALWVTWRLVRAWTARAWPAFAPHAGVAYALGLLLASRYLLRDSAAGGGNLLYATLVLVALELAWSGRALAAGVPLALSLVLKPNLLPLALAFARRGRARALAASAAAGLLLWLVPGLWYGLERWCALTRTWASSVASFVVPEDPGRPPNVPAGMAEGTGSMNQNLHEALARLLVPARAVGAVDVHVLDLDPAAAQWIARGLGALLALAVLLTWLRARGARAELLATLALFPLCLLVSPITWKAHHVVLLPLLAVLVALACAERRRWLGWTLAGYYLGCVLLSEEFVGKRGKELLQSLSVVTWGALALLVVTLQLAREEPRPARLPRAWARTSPSSAA